MNLDFVAAGDIALMAGLTTDAVHQWVKRTREGQLDFPEPAAETSGGKLWNRSDVERWLEKTGRTS